SMISGSCRSEASKASRSVVTCSGLRSKSSGAWEQPARTKAPTSGPARAERSLRLRMLQCFVPGDCDGFADPSAEAVPSWSEAVAERSEAVAARSDAAPPSAAATRRARRRSKRNHRAMARTASTQTTMMSVVVEDQELTHSCAWARVVVGTSDGADTRPFVAQNTTPTAIMRTPVTIDMIGSRRPKNETEPPRRTDRVRVPTRVHSADDEQRHDHPGPVDGEHDAAEDEAALGRGQGEHCAEDGPGADSGDPA